MKEAIDKEGLLGLFMGGFTSCAAGVSASLIFFVSRKLGIQARNEILSFSGKDVFF